MQNIQLNSWTMLPEIIAPRNIYTWDSDISPEHHDVSTGMAFHLNTSSAR
jgi:hypothetical protein